MDSDPQGRGRSLLESNTTPKAGEPQPDVAPAAPAHDSAYGETWFTATGRVAPARLALTHDIDVDVCVIGGGLAGLTLALEVARRGWSVAVLEARRVAWNASSRNTGFVLPGFAQSTTALIERVGQDRARELWMLSQDGVDYMRRTIKDGRMRDVAQSEGWLHVSKTDRKTEISDEAEMLRGFGADIEVWPANLVRAKVKSPYYFQAIHFPTAFNIHAYNYALALAQLAENAGARIFEQTAATSIDPAGVRKRVVTPQGRVRAAHIVFAGNVHLGKIMPEVSDTLIPVHTFVAVTKPLGEVLATAIEYHGAVSDTDFADHHYRIVGGDRLMFAGRMATRDASPVRYGRRLRADLRQRFPQLGAVEIEHAWSGAIGLTVHRMPQIGEISPGVWLASGFGGHGLNTSAMAATLIAGAIVEGDDRFRLFEPFELVWAGGRMGRFLAKRFYTAHRKYERWQSRRARKKELWWIANEPRLKKEAEEAAERARIRAEQYAIAEAARIEREKIEAEQAELSRIERERIAAEKAEAKRIRAEEKAAAKAETARLKEERRAAERAEKERIAAEKAEAKRIEAERVAAERADAERLEAAYQAAERVAENAARLAAETPVANPPEQDQVEAATLQGAADLPPAVVPVEAEEPKTEPSDDAKPQRRRGFWRKG
jgi:glycine/D-amino acid oxidase-like deaminating enzyme